MLFDLTGKVALVTGSGDGLGFEMAKAMAKFGAHVLLNGRRQQVLESRLKEITSEGGQANIACFDVGDTEAATRALARIVADFGSIDILVNNVGLRDRSGIWNLSLDRFAELLNVNLVAAFHLAREAARAMIEHKRGGTIINLGTAVAQFGYPADPAYSASKAGLSALTRCLAAELGRSGITVNTILPGTFTTTINRSIEATGRSGNTRGDAVLGRTGRPQEIAGAVLYLASEAGRYVTGAELSVDGGFSIAM